MSEDSEDRYEAIELIVRVPAEGSWHDRIYDLVTADCQGTLEAEAEEQDLGVDISYHTCTCGMESMGGMTGTLDDCFAWSTNVGKGLQPIDLARTIIFLTDTERAPYVVPAERAKVIEWARSEVSFEEYLNKELEDDDDRPE